jgi:type VI secretion system FHA domain protein
LSSGVVGGSDPVELMRALGQRYRSMAAGYALLLNVRARIKRETAMDVTSFGGLATNPLKFSTEAEAVQSTVMPRGAGYLAPQAAIDEAVADLRNFPAELLDGVRGAVRRLLARFRPEGLEQQLEEPSLFERVLPGQRKARFWELYQRRYGELAGDAERYFLREIGAEEGPER